MTWDWQVFLSDDGSGRTYLQWMIDAWGWTLAVAGSSWVVAVTLGAFMGTLRTLPNSPWLTRPELIEIVAGNVALSPRDQRRVSNFSVRMQLRRASEVAQIAATPASAMPAASAASSGSPRALSTVRCTRRA